MEKDLVIDRVGWHTRRDPASADRVRAHFAALLRFLDENLLVTHPLWSPGQQLGDDTELKRSDLTDEGWELIRAAHDKWLRALSRADDPGDIKLLERALARLRGSGRPQRDGAHARAAPVNTVAVPKRASRSEPREPEPVVFDKAAWHLEGDWPKGLDSEQAYVHTGFFLGWLAERELLSEEIAAQPEVLDFKERRITGPELYRKLGGSFVSDMMSSEAEQFVMHYFKMPEGKYIQDYDEAFGKDVPTLYHVPDNWDSYQRIKRIIDDRFAMWRGRRT